MSRLKEVSKYYVWPIYKAIRPKLRMLFYTTVDHDYLVALVKKLRKEKPDSYERRIAEDIIKTYPFYEVDYHIERLLNPRPPIPFGDGWGPMNSTSRDIIKFYWDEIPDNYHLRSQFHKMKNTSYDPSTIEHVFLYDSYLFRFKYVDYGGGYIHGNDLYITILFEDSYKYVSRTVQALIPNIIYKRPPRHTINYSNRLMALML